MPLAVVHHPAYCAEIPAGHRFPMNKFRRLAEVLVEEGIVAPGSYRQPAPAPAEWVALAHERAYVDQVFAAAVPPGIAREVGLPMSEAVGFRARCATAGTVLTAMLALEHGIACNTAGGSHHARRAHGAGFCVFNDVAVAIRVLMADGAIRRAMVVDLDAEIAYLAGPRFLDLRPGLSLCEVGSANGLLLSRLAPYVMPGVYNQLIMTAL